MDTVKEKYRNLYFENKTDINIANQLCNAYISHDRIKITYHKGYGGNYGYSSMSEIVFCYVGRSTGQHQLPLEMMSKRSLGGGSIMTNKINTITTLCDW